MDRDRPRGPGALAIARILPNVGQRVTLQGHAGREGPVGARPSMPGPAAMNRTGPGQASAAGARTMVTGTAACASIASATDPRPPAVGSPMPRAPRMMAWQP